MKNKFWGFEFAREVVHPDDVSSFRLEYRTAIRVSRVASISMDDAGEVSMLVGDREFKVNREQFEARVELDAETLPVWLALGKLYDMPLGREVSGPDSPWPGAKMAEPSIPLRKLEIPDMTPPPAEAELLDPSKPLDPADYF